MAPLILLVDDDTDTRSILRAALEVDGHEVLEAATGTEGLRIARERTPAVIVGNFPMDVPGQSPFIGAVRDEPSLKETRIISFSSRQVEPDDAGPEERSDLVILKPAEPREIGEAIAKLLSGK